MKTHSTQTQELDTGLDVLEIAVEGKGPIRGIRVSLAGDSIAAAELHRNPPPLRRPRNLPESRRRLIETLEADFRSYFGGSKVVFNYCLVREGTDFQRSVWDVMDRIPYGETRTYKWIAGEIGKPGAVRAVGNACGRNPIPIITPCHRVVASDGSLGGFTGGLALKRQLLRIEGIAIS